MKTAAQLREEATRAMNLAWEAEAKERDEANKAAIGRSYKYNNSYGSGDRWWLYKRVVGTKSGNLVVFQFETDSHGETRISPSTTRHSISDGWLPIKTAEFDRAWKVVARRIAKLTP